MVEVEAVGTVQAVGTGQATANGVLEVVGGLPTHALVLHAAVALVPLAVLGTLAVVVSPLWSERLRWVVVAFTAVATVAVFVTVRTGEALQDRLGVADDPLVARHAELGAEARWWMLGFLVVLAGWAVAEQVSRPEPDSADRPDTDPLVPGQGLHRMPYGWVRLLGVVALLVGMAATVAVLTAGHAGTRSVWEATVDATR